MPSEYRLQLERKIDGIAALERSGYGATYGKARRATLRRERVQMVATVLVLIACVLAASYGDTLSGVNPAGL